MKKIWKMIWMLTGFVLAAGYLISCEEDDSKKEWGFAKVYMPQAALKDGGITNNYPVPFTSVDEKTQNYERDTISNMLYIPLGVYRSGLQPLESFSVQISIDDDATATAIANTEKSAALPQDCYTLPGEITVPDGQREATFMMTVNVGKIIDEYLEISKKRLIVVVGISNPSKYELNESLAKTVVVINCARFTPPAYGPELIAGGTFDDYTDLSDKWTVVNQLGTAALTVIENNQLKIGYTTPVRCGAAIYQAIELESGKEYEFAANLSISGQSETGGTFQFLTLISTVAPTAGGNISSVGTYSADNNFFAWMGTFLNSNTGNIYRTTMGGRIPVTNMHTNIASDGLFTAWPSYAGRPVYVIFAFFSSDASGNAGTILIDNVSVREYITD